MLDKEVAATRATHLWHRIVGRHDIDAVAVNVSQAETEFEAAEYHPTASLERTARQD